MEMKIEQPEPPKKRTRGNKNILLTALQKSLHNNCFSTGQITGLSTNQLDKIGKKMFNTIVKDPKLVCNQILRNELQTQVELNKEAENRNKIPSSFCLLRIIKCEEDFTKYKEYLDPVILRVKRLSKTGKQQSIQNYLRKRDKRKRNTSIRYQVRKDLAVKRKRHKGKFIKSEKIDLQKAVQLFNEKELSKDLSQLNLKANQ